MICAVGQELRDYPTLVEAVRGLDVDVVIAAASPWSKREDSSAGLDIPPNVEVGAFDLFELRQLYADAAFVVVPLRRPTSRPASRRSSRRWRWAGPSSARARPARPTRSSTARPASTSRPATSRRCARRSSGCSPTRRRPRRLGAAGRAWVVEHADIDAYARDLAGLL